MAVVALGAEDLRRGVYARHKRAGGGAGLVEELHGDSRASAGGRASLKGLLQMENPLSWIKSIGSSGSNALSSGSSREERRAPEKKVPPEVAKAGDGKPEVVQDHVDSGDKRQLDNLIDSLADQ